MNTERKSMDLEVSELNRERRTAVIAHAVYNNVDRFGDISRKGMFNKSWNETKASNIRFDIDHDPYKQPGLVKSVWEDEKKAYTKVSFGSHTLGNDTMLMMDEGIIRGASFEFITEKKGSLTLNKRKVRELLQVSHIATTVTLALPPVNPEAGVVTVTKADMGMMAELKARIEQLEKFCRNTTASDECIENILSQIGEVKSIISRGDTAFSTADHSSDASVKDFANALHLLTVTI
jgi:phage head maturation protease